MTIKDRYTVTQYTLNKITLEKRLNDAGEIIDIVGYAYVELFNADGDKLGNDRIDLGLTTGEKTAVKNRVAARIATFESATGWTPYEEPE
jgi:hypothetical protein